MDYHSLDLDGRNLAPKKIGKNLRNYWVIIKPFIVKTRRITPKCIRS